MWFRVECRRQSVDGEARFLDAADVDAIDAIDAAVIGRQRVAELYRDPPAFWAVLAVNPLNPEEI